jgi:hypothetical protein
MTRATKPIRSLAAVVVAAILALVLSLLGVAYLAIGLAGGPPAFMALGGAFVAAGLVFDGLWLLLRARARAARERATATLGARARATIVAVEPHPYIRVGSLVTVTLTVRTSAAEFARRLYVSPLTPLEPGRQIEIAYEPDDPANFRPLDA